MSRLRGAFAYVGIALAIVALFALALIDMDRDPPRRLTTDPLACRCADSSAVIASLRDSLTAANARDSALLVANGRLITRYWATWKDSTR